MDDGPSTFVYLTFNKELAEPPTTDLNMITLHGSVTPTNRAYSQQILIINFMDDASAGNIVDIPLAWGLTSIDGDPIHVHIAAAGAIEFQP